MTGIDTGTFDDPTTSTLMGDKGRVDELELTGGTLIQVRLEPGWSWTEDQQPIVGTDRCEHRHLGLCTSGTLHLRMRDGEEREIGAGDAFAIAPGHEAWVVGDEAFTALMVDTEADVETGPSRGAMNVPH